MAFLLLLCTACTGDFSDSLYVPDDNVDPNDPNRSTLTIKYLYEDGTEAAETVRGNIYAPNHYLIRSPKISGYESNLNYVSVTANGEDIEKIVTDTLVNFKTRLLAIPAKLSPILAKKKDQTEIFKLMKAAIDETLEELSDFDRITKEGGEDEG